MLRNGLARAAALVLGLIAVAMAGMAWLIWRSDGLSWGLGLVGVLVALALWAVRDLLRRGRIGWQHCVVAALLALFWVLARTS